MLDFGLIDTKKNEAIISGPQFEQEASKAKLVQHGFTGTSQETVYTVPTGKTFFVGFKKSGEKVTNKSSFRTTK